MLFIPFVGKPSPLGLCLRINKNVAGGAGSCKGAIYFSGEILK
jgi:hypothetical protein